MQPQIPFEALSEIAQTINTIQESTPLLENVLEIAMHALAAERGFILLKSEKNRPGFEIRSSRNFSDSQISDITDLSSSVVNEVLRSGEPLLLFEAQKDPRYSEAQSIVIQNIQSIACVPLTLKNKQIGTIYLDSLSRRSKFTEKNLPFLQAFANQAAIAIENARLYDTLRAENRRLREEVQRVHGFDEIVGQSAQMQEVFELMSRVLDSDASVLIEGESGTGKELVARAIHYNGQRKDEPFLSFFCGSLPDSLLESELFGHKKGAFTGALSDKSGLFESVHGGTFFLDEIGDLNAVIQTKLLRVLQDGEIKRVGENHMRKVDVRIISATNKSLKAEIKNGVFRKDLYYRLNTISITMPALRQRRSDIPLLAHFFLDKYAGARKPPIKGFDDTAMKMLHEYSWPGNVRELENTVQRAVLMSRSELITANDLHLTETDVEDYFSETDLTLAAFDERYVRQVLKNSSGNISQAARTLDVSRRWLHYKIKEWHIETDR
jgi:Nif-specific regulatory protein